MSYMISTLMLILFIIILINYIFKPNLDWTSEGELLLWYGKNKRKYFKIYTK